MGIRNIKRHARRDLHELASVPALYIVPGLADVPCFVRVHNKRVMQGDLAGTSFRYAERNEQQDQLVFWREQIATPARNAVVSIEPGEAYRVDHSEEPDDQTITAPAIRLSASQELGLPVPANAGEPAQPSVSPALFYTQDLANSFIRFDKTGDPVTVSTGQTFLVALSDFVVTEDARLGEFAAEEVVSGDAFQPHRLASMFFVQCNIRTRAVSVDNTVSLSLDVGGTTGEVSVTAQTIPRTTGTEDRLSTLFTRVYASRDFVDNGGLFALEFTQDTTITGLSLTVSQ